jgi:hypothetical protein
MLKCDLWAVGHRVDHRQGGQFGPGIHDGSVRTGRGFVHQRLGVIPRGVGIERCGLGIEALLERVRSLRGRSTLGLGRSAGLSRHEIAVRLVVENLRVLPQSGFDLRFEGGRVLPGQGSARLSERFSYALRVHANRSVGGKENPFALLGLESVRGNRLFFTCTHE